MKREIIKRLYHDGYMGYTRPISPIVDSTVNTDVISATYYVDILEAALIPLLETVFPDGHRFQQDNDPKHTRYYTRDYIEEKVVNWFETPDTSPDLKPYRTNLACIEGLSV